MQQKGRSDILVRPAKQDDASAIATIYNYFVDQGGSTFELEHWSVQQAEGYVCCQPPDAWLVAESEPGATAINDLLGWASVRQYSIRGGYKFTAETAIYVMPESHGHGVADILQARVDDHCRQHRIHHLVAKITVDNERSMAFHQRHGYELVGIQNEIGHIDGRWVDVAIMQKVFR